MADAQTLNYQFTLPEVDGSDDTWGDKLNQNWADVDATIKAVDDAVVSVQGRVITAGDGLSGGGGLDANVTLAVDDSVVRTTRVISAGNGLVGAGDLSEDRVITLGTPGDITGITSSVATDTSHTHNVTTTTSRTSTDGSLILVAPAMNNHRLSADHDARYYTKTQVDSRVELVGGYVRTPPSAVCRFQVWKPSSQGPFLSVSKVTWTGVQTGRSDPNSLWYYPPEYYDTTLNRFIAPVDGVYQFTAKLLRAADANHRGGLSVIFVVNGVVNTEAPRAFSDANAIVGGGDAFTLFTLEQTVQLSANDYVEVFASGNSILTGSSTERYVWWAGRLL